MGPDSHTRRKRLEGKILAVRDVRVGLCYQLGRKIVAA